MTAVTRPLDALFSPQRLGASWGAARAEAPSTPAAPEARATAELEALAASAAALPGPGARAALALVSQLRELVSGMAPGERPPAEAAALLDRLEDLVDAIELGARGRP